MTAGRACSCDNWTVEKQSSRTGPHVYSTTGLPAVAMDALHERVAGRFPTCDGPGGRPPVLLWRQEVQISIMDIRRNRTQAELAEDFSVSQATISRVMARWTPRLGEVLDEFVPAVEDLDASEQVIVDGTLSPCWDWNSEQGLFSGKHRRTGVNLQVVADLTGRLLWVSKPARGSTHDAKAIKATGILEHFKDTLLWRTKDMMGSGSSPRTRNPRAPSSKRTRKGQQSHRLAASRRRAGHRPPEDVEDPSHWSELCFSDSGERLVQAVWLWRLGSVSTSLGVR